MNPMLVQGFINVVLLAMVIHLQLRVNKQQAALRWFAGHIKIDPNWRSQPMPEDLADLVEEISNEQDDD